MSGATGIPSPFPTLHRTPTILETYDHIIIELHINRKDTVGVGWVEGDPEAGNRLGVYGLRELQEALEYAEGLGAEAVALVEGPRKTPGGYPVLVMLCEDPEGSVSRQCVVVAPRDEEDKEADA